MAEAEEMIAQYDDDNSNSIGLEEFIDLMSTSGSEEVRFRQSRIGFFFKGFLAQVSIYRDFIFFS